MGIGSRLTKAFGNDGDKSGLKFDGVDDYVEIDFSNVEMAHDEKLTFDM